MLFATTSISRTRAGVRCGLLLSLVLLLGLLPSSAFGQDIFYAQVPSSDVSTPAIQRFSGTASGSVLAGLTDLGAIQVDPSTGVLYFLAHGTLYRANADGSGLTALLEGSTEAVGNVAAFTLDLSAGYIYWNDATNARIRRAAMDGTGIQDVVSGVEHSAALAVDAGNGTIYWAPRYEDVIRRASLDGSGAATVIDASGVSFFEGASVLEVYDGKLYWADGWEHIAVANLDGSEATIIHDNPAASPQVMTVADGKIYWGSASDNAVMSSNLDGSEIETLQAKASPSGIAVDVAGNAIYWTDGYDYEVNAMTLNGIYPETLIESPIFSPSDVAVDLANRTIYFTDTREMHGMGNPGAVMKANLDGSHAQEIATDLRDPRGLVLDAEAGMLYWADEGNGTINRVRTDGSGQETLVIAQSAPRNVALDRKNDKIYWTDPNLDRVYRANLDGTFIETVVDDQPGAGALALDAANDKIYWFAEEDQMIRRADLDGSAVEDYISEYDTIVDMAIDSVTHHLYRANSGNRIYVYDMDEESSSWLEVEQGVDIGGVAVVSPASVATQSVGAEQTYTFGDTGVSIDFPDVGYRGEVSVYRYENPPADVSGISESEVSSYRIVISASEAFEMGAGTEVRLDVSAFGGIEEPSEVTLYQRPSTASGAFAALTTSYDAGSNELVAEVASFGEIVLASSDSANPLPVEVAPSKKVVLHAPYPNPARTTVRMQVELPRRADVTLQVFDLLGREVGTLAKKAMPAGVTTVALDASGLGLGSGLYLVRLSAAGRTATQQLHFVR